MREMWIGVRCYASRFKLISALLALFTSGALVAIGLTAWHYDSSLARQQQAYEGQIQRLQGENRERMEALGHQIAEVATNMDSVSDAVGELLQIAKTATEAAQSAASTAQRAATTAQGAARNAASANIRIREVDGPSRPLAPR